MKGSLRYSESIYVHFRLNKATQGKISCKFLHVLCTERALNMSPFLQETCKNCARNFTFLAQILASSKNLVRNLQGARILHIKCPFSCSVSRILQDIFPWVYYRNCGSSLRACTLKKMSTTTVTWKIVCHWFLAPPMSLQCALKYSPSSTE